MVWFGWQIIIIPWFSLRSKSISPPDACVRSSPLAPGWPWRGQIARDWIEATHERSAWLSWRSLLKILTDYIFLYIDDNIFIFKNSLDTWLRAGCRSKLNSLKSSPMEFIKAWSSSWGSKSGMKLSKSDEGLEGNVSGVSWDEDGGGGLDAMEDGREGVGGFLEGKLNWSGPELEPKSTNVPGLTDDCIEGEDTDDGLWMAGDWSAFLRGG